MKIDFQNPVQLAKSGKSGDSAGRDSAQGSGWDRKVDVVDFTRGRTVMGEKKLLGLKARLQNSISYPAEASRLEALQDQVRQGTYYISTDQLVNSILYLDERG